MYASNFQPQSKKDADFSIDRLQHQKKILDILRIYLPEFAKEFVVTPAPEPLETDLENYISGQIINFLANRGQEDYLFGFQAIGPDILVYKFGCKPKTLPLFVIEAKRLRSASKKEYVDSGIERFKTEEHGKGHNFAAMLGYVQEKDFDYWHHKVNSWIDNLADNGDDSWSRNERLNQVQTGKFAEYESTHSRRCSQYIKIYHFWICLN